MRRSASEIIRNLETRIAQLEKISGGLPDDWYYQIEGDAFSNLIKYIDQYKVRRKSIVPDPRKSAYFVVNEKDETREGPLSRGQLHIPAVINLSNSKLISKVIEIAASIDGDIITQKQALRALKNIGNWNTLDFDEEIRKLLLKRVDRGTIEKLITRKIKIEDEIGNELHQYSSSDLPNLKFGDLDIWVYSVVGKQETILELTFVYDWD